MTLITEKDEQITELFKSLDEIVVHLENSLEDAKPTLNGERYFTDVEISKRLKISRRTLRDYRNQGIIPYIHLGGKILYKESDIQHILEQNYCKACKIR